MRLIYVVACAALGLAIGMAANIYLSEPADAGSWTGCYIGGAGSYNAGVVEDVFGAEGPGIAAGAGCDYQTGNLVFGGWGEYGWKQFDWAGNDVDVKGWAGGGRVGVAPSDKALLFVLVGYTDLEAEAFGGSIDLSGPIVGGGAELNLGGGWYSGAEYQYLMLEPSDDDAEANVHSARLTLKYKFNWTPEQAIPAADAPWKAAPAPAAKPLK